MIVFSEENITIFGNLFFCSKCNSYKISIFNLFTMRLKCHCLRGASKIKLKNVNKKRMATARRLIFLEFLKASIADLITLFFSWLQNSEGGGDNDSSDSFADPCQFLPFPKTKIQLSASLLPFWDLWQKTCRNKNCCQGQCEDNQSKKIEKRILNRLRWSGNNFLPKFVNNGESQQFFGRCWGFAEMFWVKISS